MATEPNELLKKMEQDYMQIRDERGTYKNTATRIGNAFLSILEYLKNAPFVRKDVDDTVSGLLTMLSGCVIGESGQIKMNPDGSISCGSIRVNGSAIFDELVFNHQNILEGDTFFTDKATVEQVEHTDINQYRLTFRKEYADDHITFHTNDILRGTVNNLNKDRTYYTVWLRVESVDTDANTALCTLYDDNSVPGGINYPPVAGSKLVRWGNTLDTSRQSCWFVSSNDGRWLFLQGVTKPILDDNENGSNYAGFIGLPPDISAVRDLIARGVITKDQPYAYFRGILCEDVIKIDYNGNPQYTARDKGIWDKDTTYIRGYDTTERGYYVDRVWYGGCYWQCSVDECTGSEPRYDNTDWTCILGQGNVSIEIVSSAGDFFRAGSQWNTDLIASVYHAEMDITKDIQDSWITWTRISDDTDGDVAWNLRHKTGSTGMTLHIDSTNDLPGSWGATSNVGYCCTIQSPQFGSLKASFTIIN